MLLLKLIDYFKRKKKEKEGEGETITCYQNKNVDIKSKISDGCYASHYEGRKANNNRTKSQPFQWMINVLQKGKCK